MWLCIDGRAFDQMHWGSAVGNCEHTSIKVAVHAPGGIAQQVMGRHRKGLAQNGSHSEACFRLSVLLMTLHDSGPGSIAHLAYPAGATLSKACPSTACVPGTCLPKYIMLEPAWAGCLPDDMSGSQLY